MLPRMYRWPTCGWLSWGPVSYTHLDYNQYQFTTNLDAKITKAIKFSMDILGREVRNRGVYSTEDLFGYFLTTNPMAAPYYPNGLLRVGYEDVYKRQYVSRPGYDKHNRSIHSVGC